MYPSQVSSTFAGKIHQTLLGCFEVLVKKVVAAPLFDHYLGLSLILRMGPAKGLKFLEDMIKR